MSLRLTLGGSSLAGNIYGEIKSAQQNKEVDELLAGRMNDLQSRFDKDYNTQYFDTEQGKSVIKTLSDQHDKSLKKIDSASAITGASAEAKTAARESSQGKFDESLTRLAGHGTLYKDLKYIDEDIEDTNNPKHISLLKDQKELYIRNFIETVSRYKKK